MNKVLIVHTSWYEKHIARMLDISVEILEKNYKCDKVKAPGAIELSALAKYKLEKNKYLGVLFLGVIVRGETSHYDLISSETFRSIGTLSDKYFNIAVINNVICVENQSQLEKRLITNTQSNANALIQLINEKSN
jgi:6,7-dimethyl-8-ribityllumazine synthase